MTKWLLCILFVLVFHPLILFFIDNFEGLLLLASGLLIMSTPLIASYEIGRGEA
jgi:hypothetical protein